MICLSRAVIDRARLSAADDAGSISPSITQIRANRCLVLINAHVKWGVYFFCSEQEQYILISLNRNCLDDNVLQESNLIETVLSLNDSIDFISYL